MMLPLKALFSRSLENPNVSFSDPDAWFESIEPGGKTAGVRVTYASALTYPPVWRAVNLIARDLAKLPLIINRRIPSGGKERDPTHPSFPILKYDANPWLTSYLFRFITQARALLWGNGYGWILRNASGEPLEIFPVSPEKVEVLQMEDDGTIFYRAEILGERQLIAAKDMIHIKGLGDGVEGVSVVGKARESLGLGIAAQRFGGAFFQNNARPSMVIESPDVIDEETHKRLRSSWEKIHGGPDNAMKPAILEQGMSLKPFAMSNEDAQFMETRQFGLVDVANWFGVPPHKLGESTRTSFSSLAEENQSYLDDALDPWLVQWEAELRAKMLTERQKVDDTHAVNFIRNALVRTNIQERGTYYKEMVLSGIMNRDEVRELEEMNPIPGGEGQIYFVPINQVAPIDDEDDSNDEGDESASDGERQSEVLSDAAIEGQKELLHQTLARMGRRIWTQAQKQAKHPDGFVDWVDEKMPENNREAFSSALGPVLKVCGRRNDDFYDDLMEYFRRSLMRMTDFKPEELHDKVTSSKQVFDEDLPTYFVEDYGWNGDSTHKTLQA